MKVEIPAQKSRMVKTLDLNDHIQKHGANGLLTWLKLDVGGQTVSENLVTLTLPKDLKLLDPKLTASIQRSQHGFEITLKSEQPALWAWIEVEGVEARFSDNFIHLQPGSSKKISVQLSQSFNRIDLEQGLRVHSLFDACLPA